MTIDLTTLVNYSGTISAVAGKECFNGFDEMSETFEEFQEKSVGKKILQVFLNSRIQVPERLSQFKLIFNSDFLKKSNIEKSLFEYLYLDKHSKLQSWHMDQNGLIEIKMQDCNPLAIVSILADSVKKNHVALGRDAILFDYQSLEKITGISAFQENRALGLN